MASAAAIAGISINGLGWKHEIALSTQMKLIGDMDADTPPSAVSAATGPVVTKLRGFIAKLKPDDRDDLGVEVDRIADDLEMVGDDLAETRASLMALYDLFDFERVVVV